MAVERLKVLAPEILVDDVLVGWDRSGARERVVKILPPISPVTLGFGLEHPWGTTAVYIEATSHVFIERNTAMTRTDPTPPEYESLDRAAANRIALEDGPGAVFQVRSGTRHIGWYTDSEVADAMAEFYDAEVFDWATGDRA